MRKKPVRMRNLIFLTIFHPKVAKTNGKR
jgi:hypothetical protein